MEVGYTKQTSWKKDQGLKLLLPLYHFLRNTCVETACHILVQDFKNAQYIRENINKHILPEMKLLDLLNQINLLAKNNDKLYKKSGKSGCAPNSQLEDQNAQIGRPKQICNIKDNEKTLSQVTVENLLLADKQCKILRDLDLIFVLNVITNEIINYTLSDPVREALYKIKKIRNILHHPRFSFSENDFENNLRGLVLAVHTLYLHLGYPPEELGNREALCREEAKSADLIAPRILDELRCEIYKKYVAPPNYIPPSISMIGVLSKPVIEDLEKFVYDQKCCKHALLTAVAWD